MIHTQLLKTFEEDLDKLLKEFIVDFALRYEQEDPAAANPLIRWLDFTSRYVEPKPRQILYSKKFDACVPHEALSAFGHLKSLIESGGDLNPYQSKGLILHNDTSGAKRQTRTDLLWADWGIHHLHITGTSPVKGQYFTKRSAWLLFCLVSDDAVGLVDVRSHNDEKLFSDHDLIKTIAESWPEMMERFRVKNFVAVSGLPSTAADTAELRKAGVNSMVQVGDVIYLGPGGGVTTASTSVGTTMKLIRINRLIRLLASECCNNESGWTKQIVDAELGVPDLHIGLAVDGLCVHERKSNRVVVFPRSDGENGDWLAELHDLLLPQWAHDYLLELATRPSSPST